MNYTEKLLNKDWGFRLTYGFSTQPVMDNPCFTGEQMIEFAEKHTRGLISQLEEYIPDDILCQMEIFEGIRITNHCRCKDDHKVYKQLGNPTDREKSEKSEAQKKTFFSQRIVLTVME